MTMDQVYDRDCTCKCRSSAHAREIFRCIPSSTASQIRAYSVWVCHNFPLISDEIGRNILHIAAACGKWEVVEWLVKNCNVDVDLKDQESGWAALHRSFFYGQLVVSRILCNLGASLRLTDHEGFTPLDIILKDRLPYIEYIPTHPSEVYAWGSNFNYNLGLGNAQSRTVPEILEVFRKDAINIKQVAICKFHSSFLSTNGQVYTCGYGHGGRLGQGTEDISLVPSPVKGLGVLKCIEIAAGQDHLLMLMEGGQVWSCGLNLYHQLGHIPPSERCLVPKPLSLKFLKGKEIIGVCAARFHSVIFTKDCVYTFGLNAGQLGHPKGDRTQLNPRQVSNVYHENWNITHVEASDGATVCATNRGDIFVLHEYQTRKIASRLIGIEKLSVVGGHLDSRCDVAGVREGGALELRVMLLTKYGKLYLWRQTDPYLRRCLFKTQKELIISDLHLNHYSVGLITTDNEGYIGSVIPFKGSRSAPSTNLHTPSVNSKTSHGLTVLLDTDECHFIKVKKLPHIYRGTSITSDSKGRNFAILQSSPKMGLVELPAVSESGILHDFSKLYSETFIADDFHDIVLKVGKREFAAHKFILASRSDFFKKQFAASDFKISVLNVENVLAEAFEQVLKFIYTNHCDFLTHDYEVNWNLQQENGKKKKPDKTSKNMNPITILQETSRKLGMSILAKRLGGVKLINGQIKLVESNPVDKISFNRNSLTKLYDVNLISSDGSVFHCHKCILIARLDYFHSMLSTAWIENSQLENLSLPISSKVMEAILDFVYTDNADKVLSSEDPEFLCHVLLTTDQLLMPRLKELCEMALVELITLKNAAELLELASVYNSEQLKKSCMQFISINLAAVIEAKILDVLSDDVIQDLSTYYRNLVPSMNGRRIYYYNPPSHDTLEFVEKKFPVESASSFIRNRLDLHEPKVKSKNRNSAHFGVKDGSSPMRNKTNSESSEKDIVLDVVTTESTILKELSSPNKIESHVETENLSRECNKDNNKHRVIMHCPSLDQFLSLEEALLKEQSNLTILHKKASNHDMKPIPRLSQKQKKMIESSKGKSSEYFIPNSPPTKSYCPWAKLPQQSPPSPSFWDAVVAKKDSSPVSNSHLGLDSKAVSMTPVNIVEAQSPTSAQNNSEDIVISLNEIQKSEEQKLRKAVNPKIKPLHILNIEDQAIEELLILYNAKDNPKERITISRVVPEEIASPVWKKQGY